MYGFSMIVFGLNLDSESQNAQLEALGYDILISKSGGQTIVDIELDSPSPQDAVLRVVADLARSGVSPVRIDLDLVDIPEIVTRTGVSRETVRLWTTGKRRQGFPVHFTSIGDSRIWNWCKVHAWLLDNDVNIEEDYPWTPLPLNVIQRFNGAFTSKRDKANEGWMTLQTKQSHVSSPRATISAKSGWTYAPV